MADTYKNRMIVRRKKRGPKGKKDSIDLNLIKQLVLRGFTDEEVCACIGICVKTLHNWRNGDPELLQSLNEWKVNADERVVRSLYERACGYTHREETLHQHQGKIIKTETLKHYPPDNASMIFWLKNRQRGEWRDKIEVDTNVNVTVSLTGLLSDLNTNRDKIEKAETIDVKCNT